MIETKDWDATVVRDLANSLLGKPLGAGMDRSVWELAADPSKVIKIVLTGATIQNIDEWSTWWDLKFSPWKKFLAPCYSLSPDGRVLVQERVKPLTKAAEKLQLPNFLTDFKRSNYGMLKGQIVCCDYGTNKLREMAANGKRIKLITPEWWD